MDERTISVLRAVVQHGYLGDGLPMSVAGVGSCGVCMGHSPSWDGHDVGCPQWVRERLGALLDLVAVERERDSLRADVKIRDAEITRQHGIILAMDNDADQALIDRDEAIEAESQAGDRIAAERDAALARIAAIEAREAELRAEVEQQVRLAMVAGNPLAYSLRGALLRLAASPTPTGPEPAKCEHGSTKPHMAPHGMFSGFVESCPGPATPAEPAEGG